jgi:hypothetical protein
MKIEALIGRKIYRVTDSRSSEYSLLIIHSMTYLVRQYVTVVPRHYMWECNGKTIDWYIIHFKNYNGLLEI